MLQVREFQDHHQFVVKAHKVPSTEKDDGRRILMHVDSEGKILSVTQSPHTLFAFPPGALMGRNLTEAVDMFSKWKEGGNDVSDALEVMMAYTNKNIGASWRVGVIPHYSEEALSRAASRQLSQGKGGSGDAGAAAAGGAVSRPGSARALVKAMSNAARSKPAIMQVRPLNTNMLDIVHVAPGAPVAAVTLWRPEMVTGVLELDASLKILKADGHAAMALGRSLPTLYGHHLQRFLKQGAVPLTFDELMGVKAKNATRPGGGLKGRKPGALHGTGPKRQLEGLHKDGYPLALTMQAALKHGRDRERLVVMVKTNSSIKGDVATIENLLSGVGDALEAAGIADTSDQGSAQGGGGKRPPGVPALALRGLHTIPESMEGWDKSRATSVVGHRVQAATPPASTRRTAADDDDMLTARDVGLQGLDSARSGGNGGGVTARAVEINIMDSARQFAPPQGPSPSPTGTRLFPLVQLYCNGCTYWCSACRAAFPWQHTPIRPWDVQYIWSISLSALYTSLPMVSCFNSVLNLHSAAGLLLKPPLLSSPPRTQAPATAAARRRTRSPPRACTRRPRCRRRGAAASPRPRSSTRAAPATASPTTPPRFRRRPTPRSRVM